MQVCRKKNEIFDVIVVGAGPGGSNAAAVALQGGLKVLQLEKERFPRVKPCAGGLTQKSIVSVFPNLKGALIRSTSSFEFSAGRRLRFKHLGNVLRFVNRPEFDEYLVRRNEQFEHFTFSDNEAVIQVESNGFFKVLTEKRSYVGRHLVGADGGYSRVNRIFDIARPKGYATAIEMLVPYTTQIRSTFMAPCFDFGFIERGYGWVFPKDDHWCVGLYTLAERWRGLKQHLFDYVESKGFMLESGQELEVRAHRYPVGGYRLNVPDRAVYLVGDAGGFAEAIAGEGIYYALESGRLAGEVICSSRTGSSDHRAYYRRLRRTVLADTFLSWHFAGRFYSSPERWMDRLTCPLFWRPAVEGYAEGATLARMGLYAPVYLVRSLRRALKVRIPSG